MVVDVNRLMDTQRALGDAGDAEGVHQARVAVRRMRSDLRTFRRLLERTWADELRMRLVGAADALGRVRDSDVMLELLGDSASLLSNPAVAEPLLEKLRAARELHRLELLTQLGGEAHGRLIDDLTEAARHPRLAAHRAGSAREALTPLARRSWKRLRSMVRRLPDEPSSAQLHAVRIAAKRARYAAEALEPLAGEAAMRFARRLATLQTCLGDAHDASVLAAWLAEQPRDNADDALVIGELLGMQQARASVLEQEWRRHWRAARSRRLREWMRAT
jgi:CHAD domain-containing protein